MSRAAGLQTSNPGCLVGFAFLHAPGVVLRSLGPRSRLVTDDGRPSSRDELTMTTAPAALRVRLAAIRNVAEDLGDAVPMPSCAARPGQLRHALSIEPPRDVARREATAGVHVEDAPNDWRNILVDRDGAVRASDVTAGHLADHLTTPGRITIGISDLLASHAPLHCMSSGKCCVRELAGWGAVETTMDEYNVDFGSLLHQGVEVQRIGSVAEAAGLVVSSHDADSPALESIDQRKERLATLELAAADVKVAEDFNLIASRHRRQGAALLLLDFGRNGALAFLMASLPDVNQGDAVIRRMLRLVHRSTNQDASRQG